MIALTNLLVVGGLFYLLWLCARYGASSSRTRWRPTDDDVLRSTDRTKR